MESFTYERVCYLQAENIYNDEESDVTTSELEGQGS